MSSETLKQNSMIIKCFILKVQSDCFPVNRIFVEVPISFTLLTVSMMGGNRLQWVCSVWLERMSYKEILFGTDFWVLISSTRRSVNDPFHLLPSESGIWWLHWILFLLDEFSNVSFERKEMALFLHLCCSANFCLQGWFSASKLNFTWWYFALQIDELGSLVLMKALACYL